jgi:cysteine-rich repeat protein
MLGSHTWGRGLALAALPLATLTAGCGTYGLGTIATGGAGGDGQGASSSGGGGEGGGLGVCGDGKKEGTEECDDGNAVDTDACTSSCREAFCGDGFVGPGELCDPQAVGSVDCTEQCTLKSCGNGVVQSGEDCDDGNDVQEDECLNTCVVASCGDGVQQAGVEECDDGNNTDGDDCDSNCHVEAFCGNGVTDVQEGCDQGDDNGPCGICGATCVSQFVLEASAQVITLGTFDVPVGEPVCWELWEKLPAAGDVTKTHRFLTVPGADPANIHLRLECRVVAGVQTVAAVTKLGTPQSVVTGVAECADGAWHHVAFCREPSVGMPPTLTLYLDGGVIGTNKGIQNEDQPLPGVVHLGSPAEEAAMGGRIDELRVSSTLRYDGPFTPLARLPAPDAETVAHFRFDDGVDGNLYEEASSTTIVTGMQLTFLPMENFSSPGPLENVCQ